MARGVTLRRPKAEHLPRLRPVLAAARIPQNSQSASSVHVLPPQQHDVCRPDKRKRVSGMRVSDSGSVKEPRSSFRGSITEGQESKGFPSYATGSQFPSYRTGDPGSASQFPSFRTGDGGGFPSYNTGSGGGFPSYVTGGGRRDVPVVPSGLPPHFERVLLKLSKADLQPLNAIERDMQDLGMREDKVAVMLSRLSLHGECPHLLPRCMST